MKKKLLLGLLSFSLFDVKAATDYQCGLIFSFFLLSGAGLENSRANWNTERKTVKDKVFYYGKLGSAVFVSVGIMCLALKGQSNQ